MLPTPACPALPLKVAVHRAASRFLRVRTVREARVATAALHILGSLYFILFLRNVVVIPTPPILSRALLVDATDAHVCTCIVGARA